MRGTLALFAALALAAGVAACGSDDNKSDSSGTPAAASGGGGSEKSGKIALLLPETKTTRYEEQDRPRFEAKVKENCPKCEILYSNANQDASRQQQQAEAAITNGANVIVLDAVDADAAQATVNRAKQSNIPVIAYDRLISKAPISYYVSFDNVKVGKIQAQALLDKLGGADGKQIVMLNGSPTDPSSGDYKKGAHEVFDASGIKIAKEYDTPDWSPDKAQEETEQAITAVGKDKIAGVYSANDGMIGGAIAAMKSAGMDPKTIATTGQDSEIAAIQRILTGEQYMTIYLAIRSVLAEGAELRPFQRCPAAGRRHLVQRRLVPRCAEHGGHIHAFALGGLDRLQYGQVGVGRLAGALRRPVLDQVPHRADQVVYPGAV